MDYLAGNVQLVIAIFERNKTNYNKIKLGLGVPPDVFGDTKIFNK